MPSTIPPRPDEPCIPSLTDLVARYAGDDPHDDPPDPPAPLTLIEAMTRPGEHHRVLTYLADLGIEVRRLDDLLLINDDPDEEELHAWRCREGIAVSIASDGAWLLFSE